MSTFFSFSFFALPALIFKVSYVLICYIILLWDHTKIHHQTCQKGKARKGRPLPPQILADQLTLSLPGGADYSHHIIACPPQIFRPSYGPVCQKGKARKGRRKTVETHCLPHYVQTCSILSKRVQTCSNLFKNYGNQAVAGC